MNEVDFDKGPGATIGDIVIASVSLFGALAVTVVHLGHLRQTRSRRTEPSSH